MSSDVTRPFVSISTDGKRKAHEREGNSLTGPECVFTVHKIGVNIGHGPAEADKNVNDASSSKNVFNDDLAGPLA